MLRAFCLDGDDVHRSNIPLLQGHLLSTPLERFEEVWIFPGAIFHFRPTEELVVTWRNCAKIKMPGLICRCLFVEAQLTAVRFVRHQHDPQSCGGDSLCVGDPSLRAGTLGTDGPFCKPK